MAAAAGVAVAAAAAAAAAAATHHPQNWCYVSLAEKKSISLTF